MYNIVSLIMSLYLSTTVLSDILAFKSKYHFITSDKVNVRLEPNINSRVLLQLRIAERVIVISRSNKIERLGNLAGEWVYIDTHNLITNGNGTYKGWIFSAFLADYSVFQKVKEFRRCVFKGTIGDYVLNYEFDKNGGYKRWETDESSGNKVMKRGNIYRYKNIIIAKDEKENIFEDFFLNENEELCNAYRDLKGNTICVKCED
jgi:hypothetical protein